MIRYQAIFVIGLLLFGIPFVGGLVFLLAVMVLSGWSTVTWVVVVCGMIATGLCLITWADRRIERSRRLGP